MMEDWIGVELVNFRGERQVVSSCDFCRYGYCDEPYPDCRGGGPNDWAHQLAYPEQYFRKPRLAQIIEAWIEHEREGRETALVNQIMLEVAAEYGV
jgi:hypothetical protein